MKKTTIFCAIVLIVSSFFVCIALAHSGGTDSSGGHYDNSTDEYHYHHGHSAHQHKNGVCPYDSKDIEEETSSWLDYFFRLIGFVFVIFGGFVFFGSGDAPEHKKTAYLGAGFSTALFGFSLTGLLRSVFNGEDASFNLIFCLVMILIATISAIYIKRS